MNADAGRRLVTLAICAPIVSAFGVACSGESAPTAAECIKVIEESGQTTDECLPVAPDSDRVDLVTAIFSKPTPITNPLHPTSEVKQVIMGGQVDDKPFRTEVTLLPGTRPIHGAASRSIPRSSSTSRISTDASTKWRWTGMPRPTTARCGTSAKTYSTTKTERCADTKGTWVASDKTPAAMIMPAKPAVGDIYRPRTPPRSSSSRCVSRRSTRFVHGPSGEITGAIEVMELHMDGTTEGKVFAPGYGEFSTGTPGGDLEAVSLASPTDSRQGPAPAELGALSGAAAEVFDAVNTQNLDRAEQAGTAFGQTWEAALTKGNPPQMESQMYVDIDALKSALGEGDWRAAESAALRVSENELDLRLLYQPVIDVDLARLALWARQLPVDVKAEDPGLVLADVAALGRVWERTRPGLQDPAAMDTAMQRLRRAADAEDLPAVGGAAAALNQAVAGLHIR